MSSIVVRGTLVSFDAATYTALVMLDGSLAEISVPVGEWVPKSQLAADDQVAVLLFQEQNYENGVILGAFGAASGELSINGTPLNGQIPIGSTATGLLLLATITGTANQITVTNGANTITLSGPQDLAAGSSPTFAALSLTGKLLTSTARAARAYHSTNTSITNDTLTVLSFDSEVVDEDTIHSTSSNTSRLTAQVTGWYLVAASVEWAANTVGYRQLNLRLNGGNSIAHQRQSATPTTSATQSIATLIKLTVGDYVEVQVRQTSGGALNVLRTADFSPEFAMVRLA